jgi:HNH endonuclease
MPLPRPYIADTLRRKVLEDAQHRCGYCLTSQHITAMPMHIEHLIPLAAGGTSDEENLWVACPLCNGAKGTRTHYPDPETGEEVPLFNPRRQVWREHFRWSESSMEIIGLTPCGRATVIALKLNNEYLTRARRRWVLAGWHPPLH